MLSFPALSGLLLFSIYTRASIADDPGTVGVQLDGNGPVIHSNFPDPSLARDTSTETWYAFSTQNNKTNIQMATSTDFSNWTLHDGYDALPELGSWARKQPYAAAWAPNVNQRPDGSWVMYYAALHRHNYPQRHCISAAISPTIGGPYKALDHPIVCDLEHGGNIDPNLFIDPLNSMAYLVYKTDGNTIGHGGFCGNSVRPIALTPLYMQLLDLTDFITPVGPPIFLFSNGPEDRPNVERPCMAFLNGTYFMIYNSHCFETLSYRVNYVSCVGSSDVTKCDWQALKYGQSKWRRPLLQTGDMKADLHAPGSVDTNGERMVFHADMNLAWFHQKPPYTNAHPHVKRDRAMFAAYLDIDPTGGTLTVKGLY